METIKIGKKLRNLRKWSKLTQQKVADSIGCSQGYIADIEKGRVTPSLNMIEKIADVLGVGVNTLLADSMGNGSEGSIIKEGEAQYHTAEYLKVAEYAEKKGISMEDIIDAIDFMGKVKNRNT